MSEQKQIDQPGVIRRIAKLSVDTTAIVLIVMTAILLLFAISIAVGVEIPWQLYISANTGLVIMFTLRLRSEKRAVANTKN
ncbi:MAG: hypothetical protein IH984_14915 [Planctomycetes bacterium]|nr:hypothetical protein [Planctomycetota bacterium]